MPGLASARLFLVLLLELFPGAQPAARPVPDRQEDFFDLLPVEYPFPATETKDPDPVAARLGAACGSLQDLAALAVASSQLHGFVVRPDGSYDLSLPRFEDALPLQDTQPLLETCEALTSIHAWMSAALHEHALSCPTRRCSPTRLAALLTRARAPCIEVSGGKHNVELTALGESDLRDITLSSARANARVRQVQLKFCLAIDNWLSEFVEARNGAHESAVVRETIQMLASDISNEIRIFLDHAFQALSLSPAGLASVEPVSQFLGYDSPAFRHVPIAGQRWDVLRSILVGLPRAVHERGLRIAEIGVEKGMTVTFLMKHVPSISEYVLVDPWHLPGKPPESNAILNGYFKNLEAWSAEAPAFQRSGQPAVRLLRLSSEKAAGEVDNDYFDLVFIDGEHSFEAVRRDIQVWKRRVRPDGGVLAGHDFSMFHVAAALAVLVECGPASEDHQRFPLEAAPDGRPLIRLAADSVWWVTRQG